MRPSTIYRLREAVKNPVFDRRHHYGDKAVPEYPEGCLIRVYTHNDVPGDYPEAIVVLWGGTLHGTLHTSFQAFAPLMAVAEKDRPRTAAEALFVADVPGHCAEEVLEVLLREGRISVHHIMDAAKTVAEGV